MRYKGWKEEFLCCQYLLAVVVQSLGRVRLFVTPWAAGRLTSLSFNICWSLSKLMSIELMMPSNHLILCCSLLLLPSIFPSIRIFPNGLALCIRWPKYWSFSFSTSHSNEYSWGWFPSVLTGWISLQINRLSRVFSKSQFKIINSSVLSFLII